MRLEPWWYEKNLKKPKPETHLRFGVVKKRGKKNQCPRCVSGSGGGGGGTAGAGAGAASATNDGGGGGSLCYVFEQFRCLI